MSPSQREDLLQRQIRAIAAMLARILGLRLSGQSEEARALLDESYGLLLGSEAELVRRIDSSTAAVILGTSEKILAFAQLTREEAAQDSDPRRCALLMIRAAELAIEAARRDPESEAIRHFLDGVLQSVDRERLTLSYRSFLEGGSPE